MAMVDVYVKWDLTPVSAAGVNVRDAQSCYLDLYGGHGVISVGHSHPHVTQAIKSQVDRLAFYSNAVNIPLQDQLASKLNEISGLAGYQLFMTNSGSESVENCLRIASLLTQRRKIVCLENAFHGRTALALALGDHKKLEAPINEIAQIVRIPLNDMRALERAMDDSVAAVIVEGIQGIGGVYEGDEDWWKAIEQLCATFGAKFIVDEVQSGFGRTGKFFAFQHYGVKPDLIAMAKGMGNGFPVGGVLMKDATGLSVGDLGTTFGGNPVACAAALSVLETMEEEKLIAHTARLGEWMRGELERIPGVRQVRGRGLMWGIETEVAASKLHLHLLKEHKMIVGTARESHTLRILPPLCITEGDLKRFLDSLSHGLQATLSGTGGR